jgi:hypothetical protein
MVLFALYAVGACEPARDGGGGGDGDGDGDVASGGSTSSGGAAAGGTGPFTGGGPSTGGTSPAGGSTSGGADQGGQGGFGGEAMGGDSSVMDCPENFEVPMGACEEGESFTCQGYVYPFVIVGCTCVETAGFDEPQWSCAL